MQAVDIEGARRDLAHWSQPVIADVISESYVAIMGPDHFSLRVLISMHARLWRLMLLDEREKLGGARKELTDLARLAGLARPVLDQIDQAVLEELLDVVTARFSRSADLVRGYSRLLLRA